MLAQEKTCVHSTYINYKDPSQKAVNLNYNKIIYEKSLYSWKYLGKKLLNGILTNCVCGKRILYKIKYICISFQSVVRYCVSIA